MRQISFDEARAVGGAACSDLTMSVGLTGVSISGSLGDWGSCAAGLMNSASDMLYSYEASYITGIPYGEAHVA